MPSTVTTRYYIGGCLALGQDRTFRRGLLPPTPSSCLAVPQTIGQYRTWPSESSEAPYVGTGHGLESA
eukprot:449096-Rhodomonas_salina.2